jgi:hypothetical protein
LGGYANKCKIAKDLLDSRENSYKKREQKQKDLRNLREAAAKDPSKQPKVAAKTSELATAESDLKKANAEVTEMIENFSVQKIRDLRVRRRNVVTDRFY